MWIGLYLAFYIITRLWRLFQLLGMASNIRKKLGSKNQNLLLPWNVDWPADWSSCFSDGVECPACVVSASRRWRDRPQPWTSPRPARCPPRCRPGRPRSPHWHSRCRRCRPARGRPAGCSVSWRGRRAAAGRPDCPACPAPPCAAQLRYLQHYQSGQDSLSDNVKFAGHK